MATLDQMFQSQEAWFNDDFYQTQYRILQSRSLAKRTIDSMKLWDAPRLGNGPEPKRADQPHRTRLVAASTASSRWRKKPFAGAAEPAAPVTDAAAAAGRIGRAVQPHRRVPRRPEHRAGPQQPHRRNPLHVDGSGVRRGRGQRAGEGVHPAEHGVPVQHLEGCGRLAGRTVSPSSARRSRPAKRRCRHYKREERRRLGRRQRLEHRRRSG